MKVKVDEVWVPTILLPLDQNECLVPHLKDPIHICLESATQDPSTTQRILYALSNNPCFTS